MCNDKYQDIYKVLNTTDIFLLVYLNDWHGRIDKNYQINLEVGWNVDNINTWMLDGIMGLKAILKWWIKEFWMSNEVKVQLI